MSQIEPKLVFERPKSDSAFLKGCFLKKGQKEEEKEKEGYPTETMCGSHLTR